MHLQYIRLLPTKLLIETERNTERVNISIYSIWMTNSSFAQGDTFIPLMQHLLKKQKKIQNANTHGFTQANEASL